MVLNRHVFMGTYVYGCRIVWGSLDTMRACIYAMHTHTHTQTDTPICTHIHQRKKYPILFTQVDNNDNSASVYYNADTHLVPSIALAGVTYP